MGELVQGPFPPAPPAWDRRRRLWGLLWSRCPGLGWARLAALEDRCGGLDRAWRAPAAELLRVPGLGGGLVESVQRFRTRWGPEPLEAFSHHCRHGRGVLVPGDPAWPEGMHQLQRPPLQLFWQGRGSLWPHLSRRRSVAVVGTRRPSLHGLTMARALGSALAAAGWPVLSGLAEGIDGAAHEGCLLQRGAPIGVLGTPLERVYPRHHVALQRQVASQGLLISEWPRGSGVRGGHFASRNRLLVALAAAVVVVECPMDSGALHSAELAWLQGLPLWVVPADAARVSALGSNRLLARGATPLLHPDDLIGQLGPGPLACRELSPRRSSACLDPQARAVLEAVGGGASLEQLSGALGRPGAELVPCLLNLELDGLLRAEPGLCWRPR